MALRIDAYAAEEEQYDDDFEDDEDAAQNTPPPVNGAHGGSPGRPQYSRSPSMHFPWALLTLDELEVEEKLAAGAMGAVHGGFYRGRPVAIKTLHDASRDQLAAVEQELLVHAALKHPRTVELLGANLAPPKCCIVMERCECSLFERLHRRPAELSRRQSMGIAIQVAEGMHYLHTRRPPVVHRDLKSHNVLLDMHGDAKLCDFGLVNTREVTAGTPNYMAPELFLAKAFSNLVDVFAFGVLLNEMWAREVPWDGYQPHDIREKVTAGERPPTPRTMPYACEALLRKLWHATPALRPSFGEALPQLQGILETLPVQTVDSAINRMPLDALDSLDALAGMQIRPQTAGRSHR